MVWNPFAKAPSVPSVDRVEPVVDASGINASTDGATMLSSDPRVAEFFGAHRASSGVAVTPTTAKCVSAAYACTRLISGAVAGLPLKVYERNGSIKKEVDHDIWWLLNEQPFPTLTAATWLEWMTDNMLMRGDGLSQIRRKRNFEVDGFMPLPYEATIVERRGDELIYLIGDYETSGNQGSFKSYGLTQDDVIHVPGFGFNGIRGESVIRYAARQSIGTALAADEFSGSFFANGMNVGTVIKYPQGVAPDKPQQDQLREQFEERYSGRANSHKPLLLVNGGELDRVSLSANDAQLIQTRQFQVIDIARAFGVPPHLIGETTASTSWGSGIEQMSIGFVRYALGPHLKRFEQEFNRKLWPRSPKYFVEFDREAAQAGDLKSEAEFFAKALGGPGSQGWMTVNQVRRKKNMEPLPGWNDVAKAGAKADAAAPNNDPAQPE